MDFTKIINYITDHNIHLIVIYILIGYLIYKLLSVITNKWTKNVNKKRKKTIDKLIKNIFKYAIIILVIVEILSAIGINVTSIAAGIGIAGVVIGLALQDLMKDVLAGFAIIFEEQFDVGDFVEINGFQGEVIDLSLKSTKIKSLENKIRTVSNRNIVEITNYSKENINVRIDIPMSYEIETKKADKVIKNIISRIEKELTLEGKVKELGIDGFNSSDIKYTILVPVISKEQWNAKRKVNKIIKEEYDKEKISIPYNIIEVKNG